MRPLNKALAGATTAFALMGGVILFGILLVTLISAAGRALFSTPLGGDFELVEMGTAAAVFAFLPYAQLSGGHVIAAFFSRPFGPRAVGPLDRLAAFLMALFAGFLAWRLTLGGIDFGSYSEVSMVLGLPLWLPFLVIVPAAVLLALVALVQAFDSQ